MMRVVVVICYSLFPGCGVLGTSIQANFIVSLVNGLFNVFIYDNIIIVIMYNLYSNITQWSIIQRFICISVMIIVLFHKF